MLRCAAAAPRAGVALARGAKALLLLALVAFVGWKIYQRWGAAARSRFDDWVVRTQPQSAQVLELLRSPARRAEVSDTQTG